MVRSASSELSLTKFLTGWGVSDNLCRGGTQQNILQELKMEILPQNTCRSFSGHYDEYNSTLGRCQRKWYSLAEKKEVISNHILCAKHPDYGRGLCQGDSGGPLTVEKDGQHVLVGVNSGGFGCGLVSLPLEIFFRHF